MPTSPIIEGSIAVKILPYFDKHLTKQFSVGRAKQLAKDIIRSLRGNKELPETVTDYIDEYFGEED